MPWLRKPSGRGQSADGGLDRLSHRDRRRPRGPVVRLSFVHPHVAVLRLVSFLLVLGLGWWKAAGRCLLLFCCGGVRRAGLGAARRLVPCGLWCVVGHVVLPGVGIDPPRRGAAASAAAGDSAAKVPSTLAAAGPPTVTILVVAALFLGCRTVCVRRRVEKPQASPPAYEVFIPLDDQQQPTRDRYFLPAEFYSQLHRRAATAARSRRRG